MALHLRSPPFGHLIVPIHTYLPRKFCVCCDVNPNNSRKLVLEVKEKLEEDHSNLPLGRYGRDDEDMILCFLKDCKFSVKDTVSKLSNAMIWRRKFGVEELCEESVKTALKTGKSYLHDFLVVHERPVLIVEVAKHIPMVHDRSEDEKLSVFLIEKAVSEIPKGKKKYL